MPLGDGIRRNIAHVSSYERRRLRDAIVELDNRYYPDGVSKWVKQDEIHEATSKWVHHEHGDTHTDIHVEAVFLPWHRELCNRFELLLREVDPWLSLHYWDWTEDPRQASDGAGDTVNLFTEEFMGKPSEPSGRVETPFGNFPPFTRDVVFSGDDSHLPPMKSDLNIVAHGDGRDQEIQWKEFRMNLDQNHGSAHRYIGGSIGEGHTAFQDPFVFLLHSNVDRLWAVWQTVPGKEWRLDPDQIYGIESHDRTLVGPLEPWAGTREFLRPWGPPENEQIIKNSKDLTVVIPPRYDTTVVDNEGVREFRRV